MATVKRERQKPKRKKGDLPEGGVSARSIKKNVRISSAKVKPAQAGKARRKAKPVLSPAQKAAETRRKEAGYRAETKKALARQQAAKAQRDVRLAKQVAKDIALERQEAATKALVDAETLFAAEKDLKRTEKQQREALERLLVKRFEAQLAGAAQIGDVKEVRLGREILEERVVNYYLKARSEEKIKSLSPNHKTGKTWRHESRVRTGAVVDRFVGRFLTEGTLEPLVRRLVKAGEKAKKLQPNGELFLSFSVVEYGRNVPKSPGPELYKDAIGTAYQAFDGSLNLGAATDLVAFEIKARRVLEERLRGAGGSNAIMVDSFQVKSYHDRTDDEKRAFLADRREARRAALVTEKEKAIKNEATGRSKANPVSSK